MPMYDEKPSEYGGEQPFYGIPADPVQEQLLMPPM